MDAEKSAKTSDARLVLQAELERLATQLQRMEQSAQENRKAEGSRPGFGKRVGDFTTEVQDSANNRAMARNLLRAMDDLKRALEKVEEGSYGSCDSCGRPIDPERLEFLPSATLCVECKRKNEQHRR